MDYRDFKKLIGRTFRSGKRTYRIVGTSNPNGRYVVLDGIGCADVAWEWNRFSRWFSKAVEV